MDEPTTYTFHRFGEKLVYEIHDDHVKANRQGLWGTRYQATVPLDSLHPSYDTLWVKDKPVKREAAFIILLLAVGPLHLMVRNVPDPWLFRIWLFFWSAVALDALAIFIPKTREVVQFKTRAGVATLGIPVLESNREQHQVFVALLVDRITTSSHEVVTKQAELKK